MRKFMTVMFGVMCVTSAAVNAADLKVAANMANLPFEYEDQNGVLTGFEVDIIKEAAQRLGKTVEFSSMPFAMLFPAIQSGRADLAIGSVTITPKRLESIAFSQAYFDAQQCLTVATKSGVAGFQGLSGKQLGVVTGTVGEIWATENQKKYNYSEIRRYDTNIDPMLDLATGRLAGFFHDCPIDAYYIKDKPQYKIVAQIETNEQFGMAFPKDSKVLSQINDEISKMKQDGMLAQFYEKWFGMKAPADSSSLKVSAIP